MTKDCATPTGAALVDFISRRLEQARTVKGAGVHPFDTYVPLGVITKHFWRYKGAAVRYTLDDLLARGVIGCIYHHWSWNRGRPRLLYYPVVGNSDSRTVPSSCSGSVSHDEV